MFWAAVRMLRRSYYGMKLNVESFRSEQEQYFLNLGLNYRESLAILNSTLESKAMPPFDERSGMCSQHWILFAGLTLKRPRRILEIGTYDGRFTQILSWLFPDAEIVTCDLPDDSPSFVGMYSREDRQLLSRFLELRAQNLDNLDNIRFLQANSFLLPALEKNRFDLVWIDGGHDYPDVAWDACNAYHMMEKDAYVAFDDVIMSTGSRRNPLNPGYNDSYKLLRLLAKEGLVDALYIYKRLQSEYVADPVSRKYICVVRKTK